MSDYKVIWSAKSLYDLDRSHDLIAKKSVSAANRMVETILGRVFQLKKLPKSGAV